MSDRSDNQFFTFLFKNASKLLSVNILSAIVAFLVSTRLTRIYSVEDFGVFSIFMTIVGTLAILATSRLEYAIILPKQRAIAQQIVLRCFQLALIVCCLSFVILFFFQDKIAQTYDLQQFSQWYYLIPLAMFSMAAYQILGFYFNREKAYNTLAAGTGIVGLGTSLAKLGFGLAKILSVGLMLGQIVANTFSSLFYGFLYLFKTKKEAPEQQISVFKKYWEFPVFNLPLALSNYISGNLPFLLLIPVFGSFTVGLYAIATGITFRLVNLISNSIYQVLSQQTVESFHTKSLVFKQLRKLTAIMILIGIIPAFVAYQFAPVIFEFIYGAEYYTAGVYFKWIIPWLFMVYLTASLSFIPNLFKMQAQALVFDLVYLVLRIAALAYGIHENSFELAIKLYALVGFVMLTIYMFWCLGIVRHSEKTNKTIE